MIIVFSLCLLVMINLHLTLILAFVLLGKTTLKHVFSLFESTNDIIQENANFCQILLPTFISWITAIYNFGLNY